MNNMTAPGAGNLAFSAQGKDGMPVFERLGIIVRALHDTLTEIGAHDVLAEAAREFPSARERLLHIADLTENAANIVLGKVEQNVPLLDDLAHQAAALEHGWSAAGAEIPDPQLIAGTRAFLAQVQQGCGTTRAALSDIMMAQDFQDLTGQLIKKVVVLMEHTENDLLKLLIDAAPPNVMAKVIREEMMAGPGAPGNIALNQESVDDLLADLGF
jgi:chemotaxis protein CheZ